MARTPRLLFVVNVDWFFLSHRLPIALEAKERGYDVHIATGVTDRGEEIEGYGLTLHPLQLQRGSGSLPGILHTWLQILGLYRELRPELVHLVTIKPVLLGGLAAHILKPKGLIAAISGLGTVFLATGFKARLRRVIVGLLYRAALSHENLKIIFQNETDRSEVGFLTGLSDNKTVLVRGSGIDLSRYKHQPLPEGRPVVMLAARMLKDKGVVEFVAAARLLQAEAIMNAVAPRFVLVGDPDPDNLTSLSEAELRAWQREGVVEWWGHCSNMPGILPQASIVVLPSYREGFPKILIEAAACGRAVVTTDVAGCRDAIEDDVTGRLTPVRNAEALASTISKLLQNPQICIEMGQAGRRMAEATFDINHVVAKHLEIYDNLLNGNEAQGS